MFWQIFGSRTYLSLLTKMTIYFACRDALRDDDLILTGWEYDILNIAKNILEEQSPRQ